MAEISELLQARVKALGIDIVDVRMKRVDFTPEISESVYSRMELNASAWPVKSAAKVRLRPSASAPALIVRAK